MGPGKIPSAVDFVSCPQLGFLGWPSGRHPCGDITYKCSGRESTVPAPLDEVARYRGESRRRVLLSVTRG
jgi:hypothetical protein